MSLSSNAMITEAGCRVCGHDDSHDSMLLCDGCDGEYHTNCLGVPAVPAGNWFCPRCVRNRVPNNFGNTDRPIGYSPDGKPAPGSSCAAYLRVSTAGQNQPEFGRAGLQTQSNEILRFVMGNGVFLTTIVTEVGSARHPEYLSELSQLESLIKKVQKNTCILVYRADRFCRNLGYATDMIQQVHDRNAWIYSVTEGVSSYDPQFIVLIEKAEFESATISQRSSDAARRKREAGDCMTSVAPYGKKVVKDARGIRTFTDCDVELRIIKMIITVAENATVSKVDAVLDFLEQENIPFRDGKQWTEYAVKEILKNTRLERSFAQMSVSTTGKRKL